MGAITNENKSSQTQAQWFQYRQTGIIATARTRPIKMPAAHTRRSGSDVGCDGSDGSIASSAHSTTMHSEDPSRVGALFQYMDESTTQTTTTDCKDRAHWRASASWRWTMPYRPVGWVPLMPYPRASMTSWPFSSACKASPKTAKGAIGTPREPRRTPIPPRPKA